MKTSGSLSCNDCTVDDVRNIIELAGNHIGSVRFIKRTNGEERSMCYRLHVKNPKYYTFAEKSKTSKGDQKAKEIQNNQITVFDVNKVIRDKSGNIVRENGKACRGAWRNIPLENVSEIKHNGIVFYIKSKEVK